ncbi:MAG: 50S ribosomal protein L23 [Candidatus Njordarchaeia archaeon]
MPKKYVEIVDPYKIIIRAEVTEKAINQIQQENKLTFIVTRKARKGQIKKSVEELFDVVVEKINTLIGPRGEKRAIVKLSKDFSALEIATNLGLL